MVLGGGGGGGGKGRRGREGGGGGRGGGGGGKRGGGGGGGGVFVCVRCACDRELEREGRNSECRQFQGKEYKWRPELYISLSAANGVNGGQPDVSFLRAEREVVRSSFLNRFDNMCAYIFFNQS